ncbi:MAG: diadenylate cyclase [Elusimicrobiota bacterium]|jgi:uncharacterized protein (TIGR00159 family)
MTRISLFLSNLRLADALDVAIVSLLLYLAWAWFRRTKAAFVVIGMLILTGVYIIARVLDLTLTAYLFQGFFAVSLFAFIVIFQEEIRHFFERVAVFSMGGRRVAPHPDAEITELVQALGELAREKYGALIVLRGRDPIERHITEGHQLDGKISRALLMSIFDPHSEGHDGAMVIGSERVERFSVYLPLGRDLAQNARLGTRHAAAIGLSELGDALCIVVSEERGQISVAEDGRLEEIRDLGDLRARIDAFRKEKLPSGSPGIPFWRRNLHAKVAAVLLAFGFWFHFVYSEKPTLREYDIPVALHNVPVSLRVSAVEPAAVRAVLAGARRSIQHLDSSRLRAHLDVARADAGESELFLGRESILLPEGIVLVRMEPAAVRVIMSPRR